MSLKVVSPENLGQVLRAQTAASCGHEGIRPQGMAKFYWGLENASGTRRHGEFYPPCLSKCRPILGFLLCGGAS